MRDLWSESDAADISRQFGPKWGEDLALQAYCSRLLAGEKEFALPGGASLSVKGSRANVFGENAPAMWIMEAGGASPSGFVAVDLLYLRRLRELKSLADGELIEELRTHVFHSGAPVPPPETMAHALLPMKYVIYARAGAVLALAEQGDGAQVTSGELGGPAVLVPHFGPAFEAAKAAAEAYEARPQAQAVIWAGHGIVTWGDTARAAYCSLVEIVSRAEAYLDRQAPPVTYVLPATQEIDARIKITAPIVRGLLARRMTDSGQTFGRVILRPLCSPEVNGLLAGTRGKEVALMAPLAAANAAITKPFSVWVDSPDYGDPEHLRRQVSEAMDQFERSYKEYYSRNAPVNGGQARQVDSAPAVVVMPGVGALCAGTDVAASATVRDAAEATFAPRSRLTATAVSQSMPEAELFRQEHSAFARPKPNPRRCPAGSHWSPAPRERSARASPRGSCAADVRWRSATSPEKGCVVCARSTARNTASWSWSCRSMLPIRLKLRRRSER